MVYNLRSNIKKPKRLEYDSDSDEDRRQRNYNNFQGNIEVEFGLRTPNRDPSDTEKLKDDIKNKRGRTPKIVLRRLEDELQIMSRNSYNQSSRTDVNRKVTYTSKMFWLTITFLLISISLYWFHSGGRLGHIFNLDKNYELIVEPAKNLAEKSFKSEKQEIKRSLFIEQECRNIEVNEFNYDYASKSNGARILSTFDTEPYGEGVINFKFLGLNLGPIPNILFPENVYNLKGPSSLLEDSGKIGDCWAFRKTWGRARIQLSRPVYLKKIILEHHPMVFGIAENSAAKSAPRYFSITGIDFLENGQEIHSHLGTFEFEKTGRHIQVFHITSSEANYPFGIIELHVTSNHGNKDFTCVYRLRVYGRE